MLGCTFKWRPRFLRWHVTHNTGAKEEDTWPYYTHKYIYISVYMLYIILVYISVYIYICMYTRTVIQLDVRYGSSSVSEFGYLRVWSMTWSTFGTGFDGLVRNRTLWKYWLDWLQQLSQWQSDCDWHYPILYPNFMGPSHIISQWTGNFYKI